LLRLPDVQERIGLRRSWIFKAIKAGSFPRPVKHGRAILFVESEIDAWVRARIAERDGSGVVERVLITEREIAEALDVSVSWLQKDRVGAQLIPFVKIGTSVRYDLNEARLALRRLQRGGQRGVAGAPNCRP
jgi:prophage regulatory protein